MSQPKIRIERDLMDNILEGIGIIGMLLLIGLPVMYYGNLPGQIPSHYGLSGPDGYSGKGSIWLLPVLGVVLYVGMQLLNKNPQNFNLPIEITEENAGRLYRASTKMIRILNVSIVCIFAYIVYATIQIALGKQEGLGRYFMPVFLLLTFGPTVYFFRSIKKEK